MERKTIRIGHLFPDLLNMYGDKGNVLALKNRLIWRNIDVEVIEFDIKDEIDFSALDIILLGGGADREQALICECLNTMKQGLSDYVEAGGVMLALCGSYPMLGKNYQVQNELVSGLGILEIDTEKTEKRQIGDIIIRTEIFESDSLIVGFENHSGKTYIGDLKPLGTVCHGYGNNGEDGSCGVVYKNLVGTYLHGPLLPKNPALTDYLLSCALRKKYGEEVKLSPLSNRAEEEAHDYIVKRFLKK